MTNKSFTNSNKQWWWRNEILRNKWRVTDFCNLKKVFSQKFQHYIDFFQLWKFPIRFLASLPINNDTKVPLSPRKNKYSEKNQYSSFVFFCFLFPSEKVVGYFRRFHPFFFLLLSSSSFYCFAIFFERLIFFSFSPSFFTNFSRKNDLERRRLRFSYLKTAHLKKNWDWNWIYERNMRTHTYYICNDH